MSETDPELTIGADVHYAAFTANGVTCVPAKVNMLAQHPQMGRPVVGLCVFDPRGIQMHNGCEQGGPGDGHTWHWPERCQ